MIDKQRLEAHLNNGAIEYVMCAANYYNDEHDHMFQPYNIDKGFVVCGWRHPNCGMTYIAMNSNAKRWDDCIQGFLTTKNRFLTRSEALELVLSTGQLTKPIIGGELTSEDLW
jgi:hypothetical protein